MKKYKLIVSGGTFDRLHIGHRQFLSRQLEVSEKIILGITSDSYIEKVKGIGVLPLSERISSVKKYLRSQSAENRVKITVIEKNEVPKEYEKLEIEAIAATEDTLQGAQEINNLRLKKNLPPLNIFMIDLIKKDGVKISSSIIRKEISTDVSSSQINPLWKKNILILPKSVRKDLQNPFGILIKNFTPNYQLSDMNKIITIGDVATKTFLDKNLTPRLSIIDFLVERKPTYKSIKDLGFSGNEKLIRIKNPAGSISPELFKIADQILNTFDNTPHIIKIDGEEDLAFLPISFSAPIGYKIFYGQPQKGIVEVIVTAESRAEIGRILSKFTHKS